MKTVCEFCKTEYNLERAPNTAVKCAVCGHVWVPHRRGLSKSMMKFIAALCAFIAAAIISLIVMVNFSGVKKNQPLITKIDNKNIHMVMDENGNNRIFVSGDITNTTDDIYGLPNIIIISYDIHDNVLSRQTFMPPATLLEGKTTTTFNYMLSVDPTNVKRLSVELKGTK